MSPGARLLASEKRPQLTHRVPTRLLAAWLLTGTAPRREQMSQKNLGHETEPIQRTETLRKKGEAGSGTVRAPNTHASIDTGTAQDTG